MAARAFGALLVLWAFAGTALAVPGIGELAVPEAAPVGLDPPSGIPGPAPPVVDAPASGSPSPGPPAAPDLVGPAGSWDAAWLVLGLAGVLGVGGMATLAVWGGTRFRSDEVLDHEVRSAIYRYVQEHVGASLKDITDHLGLSTTNAVWHLRKLEEGGLVRGRKFNGAKVYYPTAGGVQARNLSLASAALTNANARSVLDFIASHPGTGQREVSRLLAINHGTVRWHLKKLRDAELLEERRTGGQVSYHATSMGTEALRHVAARAAPEPAPPAAPAQALTPAAGRA